MQENNNLYYPKFCDKWNACKLYDLANWKNGLAFKNINFSDSGYPVIKIAELKSGLTKQTRYTKDKFHDTVKLIKGDMVFSWSGNPETSIDAFWYDLPTGWLNQHIFKITVKKIVEDKYFYYLLKFLKPTFKQIATNKQTTGLGHVTIADLKRIQVKLPEMCNQKQISSILSALDNYIEVNQKINNKLEEIAQTLFKQWITDFNFPDENGTPYKDSGGAMIDSELGKIPKGWQIVSLGQFIKFIKGKKPNLQSNKQFQNSSLYLTIDVLQGSTSIFCDSVKMITSDERNILMVMDGASSGDVYRGVNGVVASTLAKIEVSNSLYLGLVYLYLKYFMIEIKSQNYGAAIPHLDKNYVLNMKLALPCEPLIIKVFSQIDEEITKLIHTNTKEITTLINIRDSLLPKLMSGEIDVTHGV